MRLLYMIGIIGLPVIWDWLTRTWICCLGWLRNDQRLMATAVCTDSVTMRLQALLKICLSGLQDEFSRSSLLYVHTTFESGRDQLLLSRLILSLHFCFTERSSLTVVTAV